LASIRTFRTERAAQQRCQRRKFEQIIAEGRGWITTAFDRVTVKLLRACAPTKMPNKKCNHRSPLQAIDDQGARSTHAQCVSLADLRSCWDDSRVADAVRRVVGGALEGSEAPKLAAPQETKELLAALLESIEQLAPAMEITQKALEPALSGVMSVLDNIIYGSKPSIYT
jgi:hypothetical protein